MKGGSKGKYDPKTFPLLAEGYARAGMIDIEICKKLRISQESFYKYQREHPEFSEAIKRGKAPVDFEVENALLKRAMGFEYEEKTTEVEIGSDGQPKPARIKTTKKMIAGDVGAQAFWLKNRKPETWRDKHDVTISSDPFTELLMAAAQRNGNIE